MAKVELFKRPFYNFSYTYTVTVNDINLWGHVGIPQIIAIIHLARRDMLISMGFDEDDLGDNTALIIADCSLRLKKELHLDDINSFSLAVKMQR